MRKPNYIKPFVELTIAQPYDQSMQSFVYFECSWRSMIGRLQFLKYNTTVHIIALNSLVVTIHTILLKELYRAYCIPMQFLRQYVLLWNLWRKLIAVDSVCIDVEQSKLDKGGYGEYEGIFLCGRSSFWENYAALDKTSWVFCQQHKKPTFKKNN